ncbi:MAG: hypothetical protein O3A20_08980, partial [Planctomycetota bacterium]|nr:hypothetical protein [Planctomycetota bacterium]
MTPPRLLHTRGCFAFSVLALSFACAAPPAAPTPPRPPEPIADLAEARGMLWQGRVEEASALL